MKLTPVRKLQSYAVIIRAIGMRGKLQQEALAELDRRGLWLSEEQRVTAGLPPKHDDRFTDTNLHWLKIVENDNG